MTAAPQPYTPKIPISLALIAKNERAHIDAFNRNVRSFLVHKDDEIVLVDTGSVDGTEKRARELGWVVHYHPEFTDHELLEKGRKWLSAEKFAKYSDQPHFKGGVMRDFAGARNLSFELAKNPICMWLDLDDIVINPAPLRQLVDDLFGKHSGAIFLRYDYAHDKADGACTVSHWRERVISKVDWKWVGRCHETLIAQRPELTVARDPNFPTFVKHEHARESGFSDLRNYIMMRGELEEAAAKREPPDPRTVMYYANACRGIHEDDEALHNYRWFLKHSGSREDIIHAILNMSYIFEQRGLYWTAMDPLLEGVRVNPQDPRLHYQLAFLWNKLCHWKNVLTELQLAEACPPHDTLHAVNPSCDSGFQPGVLGSIAARELHMPELAVKYAEMAYRERPNLPNARAAYEDFVHWASAEDYAQKLQQILSVAPDKVEAAKHVMMPPHCLRFGMGTPESEAWTTGRKTLAIWCGSTAEHWGPDPAKTAIGASEKMVVELAKRLAKHMDVTVYCTLNCEPGIYDGVNWAWAAAYNPSVYRDFLIIWRRPDVVEKYNLRAGKIFVWMHDVGTNGVWTPVVQARTDKVLFLSKFQRGIHPALPEERIYYTRNGIDIARHIYAGEVKKKKIVFCSSPDRGLQTAIKVFQASGLAEKGYELHTYYGFGRTWNRIAVEGEYGFVPDVNAERRLFEYEDECKILMATTPGIVDHGRVTWQQMAQELKEAEAWLYPTRFDEISCVAAMEAMAAGCRLVATDHAALAETLAGYPSWTNLAKIPRAEWGIALAEALELKHDPAACAEFAQKFDFDPLVEQWVRDLFL
ncbi:MAG: hypothetical protein WC683_07195 [bacterium]